MGTGGTAGQDADREAALWCFKRRQRPADRSFGARPTEASDPVDALALALLGFVLLAIVGALFVGSEHLVPAVVVHVGMLVSALVALVAYVAAGVEWGIRRSRHQGSNGPA